MQEKNTIKIKRGLELLCFFLLLLILWQLCYLFFVDVLKIWKPYSVPSPGGVWDSGVNLLKNGSLFSAIGKSLGRGAAGFALAVGIGGLIGVCLHHFSYLNRNLKPLILGMQTLPSICWVPFAILWFGLNNSAILFVVVMGSAFSMALAVDDAIQNVPPLYIRAAKTMGAGQRALYQKVILPACVPSFLAALKQGWSFAWRALMSGEVMSSTVGLGQTLIVGRDMADINQVMLVILVIILVGVFIDKCIFTRAENYVLKKRGLL